ncbi:MAG: S-methyl-5-thioribose kinase [Rhodobacteraceae bacterium]|nr:S-methyl-5-thioribose kinase [Paracoccaceae bacterium]
MTAATLPVPEGYRILDIDGVRSQLADLPVSGRLGGQPADWVIEEVGDGNLNLVFIVRGPESGFAVKQALPYVRLVGESWPLPLSRAYFEHRALTIHSEHVPRLVPKIHHYDDTLALIVMELLEPHIIMRHGMIAGTEYPGFADDIAEFMARTLFSTSALALPADQMKAMTAEFAGNTAMCRITEDVIFTEPYMIAENNRWTEPWLDLYAEATRKDTDLKIAVTRLKRQFMGAPEALIHGDLHTGSVMLWAEDTRVIDPEFAFMGPMGFDIGAVVGNLLLNYFSQIGHEAAPGDRDAYRQWILATIETVWNRFRRQFLDLWESSIKGDAGGDIYGAGLFADPEGMAALAREREHYMDRLLTDALGFAAAKMTRRLLGVAHNIDLECISDTKCRATAEVRSLKLARDLMVNTDRYPTMGHVTDAARAMNTHQPDFAD